MVNDEMYGDQPAVSRPAWMCNQYALSFFGSSWVHQGSEPTKSSSPRSAHAADTHRGDNVKRTHTDGSDLTLTTDFSVLLLTSPKTASNRMFVLLIPPSCNSSCNRGDKSNSQQLDTTETKLRTSKAIWNARQRHVLFTDGCCECDTAAASQFYWALFSADLPHAYVCHRGGERFAEEFADLVGVRSDLH